ncbi:MAG TPA: SUF system NifU family Fe-S cluster assembly protein [Acidobacteriota bacterium]|nr:SUF system NifU family Fe-S cluster assembly protein [Acidobacteriota bacterium]
MSDLKALYQAVILAHNKNPKNFRRPEKTNRSAGGYNPVCGDQLTIFVEFENDSIVDIGFHGSGCAISKASASLMTGSVKGKTKNEVEQIYEKVKSILKESSDDVSNLGELAALSGVREFPVRVKCATLAWETLNNALEEKGGTVTTE